jgi:hypothetical protein
VTVEEIKVNELVEFDSEEGTGTDGVNEKELGGGDEV